MVTSTGGGAAGSYSEGELCQCGMVLQLSWINSRLVGHHTCALIPAFCLVNLLNTCSRVPLCRERGDAPPHCDSAGTVSNGMVL